ncbi:lysine--tRNA ligase [Candidatus Woesearchaeota archaeon]|nr:lysine--tRNA ligase [Candidatus Woesearchaeota archaeon]MCF7901236.1 lysine--tRNA ligase [Candidatus Woesearchaeota archaeon]MCF8013765.1 lysine--tRNA ligase [Candidatus Woesearchaeota archaeon]
MTEQSEKPKIPMNKLIEDRLKKLEDIRTKGINPYPYKFKYTKKSKQIKEENSNLKEEEQSNNIESIAGRIILFRRMGKVAFLTIRDDDGDIQIYLRKDDIGETYDNIKDFDMGDWIGATGKVFKTKTGEVTIYVSEFTMLCKATKPLPDKFHGIHDTEIKYRKRYLDLTTNPESKEILKKRALLMKHVRDFLNEEGFLEVETPILHPIYGGAAAKPFKTYHNELKMNLFLRISPELYLKKLIVGGFEKVYDINKNFRNEGIDTTHNPEFTMLELYQAYVDYNDIMNLTERIYENVAIKLNGTTKSTFKGNEIDFKVPWARITMLEAIQEYAGIDAGIMSEEELANYIRENKIPFDHEPSWGNYVIAIFEEKCEDKFIQPTFVIDHPEESTPLCKRHREDSRLIERFEPFCCGMELANAYSELNDPVHQRKLLEDQQRQLSDGNEEANPIDEDFLEAIETGMPPTGGLGIGLDRMAMLILGQESIRDVILFPLMKPEESEKEKGE